MYKETKPIRQGMNSRIIDAGIGVIQYSAGSIPLKCIMEELEAALARNVKPIDIENMLRKI